MHEEAPHDNLGVYSNTMDERLILCDIISGLEKKLKGIP